MDSQGQTPLRLSVGILRNSCSNDLRVVNYRTFGPQRSFHQLRTKQKCSVAEEDLRDLNILQLAHVSLLRTNNNSSESSFAAVA